MVVGKLKKIFFGIIVCSLFLFSCNFYDKHFKMNFETYLSEIIKSNLKENTNFVKSYGPLRDKNTKVFLTDSVYVLINDSEIEIVDNYYSIKIDTSKLLQNIKVISEYEDKYNFFGFSHESKDLFSLFTRLNQLDKSSLPSYENGEVKTNEKDNVLVLSYISDELLNSEPSYLTRNKLLKVKTNWYCHTVHFPIFD